MDTISGILTTLFVDSKKKFDENNDKNAADDKKVADDKRLLMIRRLLIRRNFPQMQRNLKIILWIL